MYERAEKGEIIEISEIKQAYQEKVDHKVSETQIYYVLKRNRSTTTPSPKTQALGKTLRA